MIYDVWSSAPYLRYLEALLAVELEERERNTIARRVRMHDCQGPRLWMSSTSPRHPRSAPPRSMNWPRAAISNALNQ
jgi:hypothetical protein